MRAERSSDERAASIQAEEVVVPVDGPDAADDAEQMTLF